MNLWKALINVAFQAADYSTETSRVSLLNSSCHSETPLDISWLLSGQSQQVIRLMLKESVV
jgi:hypothetical protein